jgi:nucleoside-diphosphate-sugar epimerase
MENPIAPEYIENPVKEVYVHGQCADISKIQEKLGFTPQVELKDGIRDQVKNLRMEKIRKTSSDELRG